MARQLSEQLEREVSAEELMKQTKANNASKPEPPPSSDPAPFDTSYAPNGPLMTAMPTTDAAAAPTEAATATAPTTAYSPETAATVHGADWHPSPPENKAANE